jgi:hypothetical protein
MHKIPNEKLTQMAVEADAALANHPWGRLVAALKAVREAFLRAIAEDLRRICRRMKCKPQ